MSSYVLLPQKGVTPQIQTPTTKIVFFDVDGTLIVSRSSRRWAADAEDWMFAFPNVPEVLQRHAQEGWTVALITNQSTASKDPAAIHKIESVLVALEAVNGWSPTALIATSLATKKHQTDPYRKPARGLYDVFLAHLGISETDVTDLRMCGDAVGSEDPHLPYRWSNSDRVFAVNIDAQFIRPVDMFGVPVLPQPSPRPAKEIVLLVGNPGSGKSTTGRRFKDAGYVHIEQDMLGSKTHTLKFAKACLSQDVGRLVIDATHGSAENRAPYEELARTYGIPLRVLWHIHDGRAFNALRDKPVPEVAYAVYSKHFAAPVGPHVEIVYPAC